MTPPAPPLDPIAALAALVVAQIEDSLAETHQ